ncbi:hypothetical protein M513_12026 [Trichuris suis]|uniref:Uncharacterized protein n=1 Tax=Trichuris suis TaxID=68888 RepID=A0A085LQ70_9BILA|nr:hypothetical protein M513_12026 [Trichuris suis]
MYKRTINTVYILKCKKSSLFLFFLRQRYQAFFGASSTGRFKESPPRMNEEPHVPFVQQHHVDLDHR